MIIEGNFKPRVIEGGLKTDANELQEVLKGFSEKIVDIEGVDSIAIVACIADGTIVSVFDSKSEKLCTLMGAVEILKCKIKNQFVDN